MLHIPPTNLLLLAAKQEPYKKAYLFTKNIEEVSGKSSGEWASRQRQDKTERVAGLGGRIREDIVKWNQMTCCDSRRGVGCVCVCGGGETSNMPDLLTYSLVLTISSSH